VLPPGPALRFLSERTFERMGHVIEGWNRVDTEQRAVTFELVAGFRVY
jgi:hypothetical protein